MPSKVSIIVPCLNEIDGLKWFLPEIKKYAPENSEIIYVDGGSTDGSFEFLLENQCFVFQQRGKGLTSALEEAFAVSSGQIIVTMSPDGNSLPERMPNLIEILRISSKGVAIASRYKMWAKSYDDDFFTAIGNRVFTGLINLLFLGEYTDTLVMMRAYERWAINCMGINRISDQNWIRRKFHLLNSWDIASSCRAPLMDIGVISIPADEPKRIGGKRKLCVPLHGTAALIQILMERCGL